MWQARGPRDPEDQGGWTEIEDPEDQGGWTEIEDPEHQGGWTEVEDPEHQGGWTEIEDPEDQGGWTEIEDPGGDRCGCRCAGTAGRRRPGARSPLTPGPRCERSAAERSGEPRTNGMVVVRLASHLPEVDAPSLLDVAEKLGLRDLATLLGEEDYASRRLAPRVDLGQLRELEARAAASALPPLRSLSRYWRLDLRGRESAADELVTKLVALPEVDHAYREHAGTDPGVHAADDPHSAGQGYLDPAPVGIDARFAWAHEGGDGRGVAVVDLEQGWLAAHRDLAPLAEPLLHGDNRDGVGLYQGHHGTAVLGELAAADNTLGVVGIAPAAGPVRRVSHFDASLPASGLVADAVLAAIPHLEAGDVLVVEVQKGYLPTEIDDADFDAIRLASALGIVVVAAAGNGGADLDRTTNPRGERVFASGSRHCRDSGAILVGAARAAPPHDRKLASNYGSRVDCYAWGEAVTSCGYGDLDAGSGDHESYTASFANTSAATAIVAGAAVLVQSRYQAVTGSRLAPAQMRALLASRELNTPQGPGVAGNVGVMPDLRAILGRRGLGIVPEVYLRDHLGDDGAPRAMRRAASPDLVVLAEPVDDATAFLGSGSGREDQDVAARIDTAVEAGRDRALYVRLANRGRGTARGVTATVYACEATTLVTPDRWRRVGTTRPVDVPQGDTLVVAGPLSWRPPDDDDAAGYVLFAVVERPGEPAPPLPPAPPAASWSQLVRFLTSRRVACRSLASLAPDRGRRGPVALPFTVAGAPAGDRERVFDLELVLCLPEKVRVELEAPLTLHRDLGRHWLVDADVDRASGLARIALPSLPSVPLGGLRLAAGARHRCRLLVHGAAGEGRPRVTVRQLWAGRELGRLTWELARPRDGR